jgi:hypothetical protein
VSRALAVHKPYLAAKENSTDVEGMPSENRKILTVDGRDFVVRWRGMIDQPSFPGVQTMGYCFTGTVNEYRLPHLYKTTEDLLFCAWEWAKAEIASPGYMSKNLGKPEDIEAFLGCK